MRQGSRYWVGSGVVIAVAVAVALLLGRGDGRSGLLIATALAAAVQLPFGWWLVRSLGTRHFLGAWVGGMGARVLLPVTTALVLAPTLHWPLMPVLLGLVGVLIGLLLVEVLTVMAATRSKVEAR